MAHFCASSRTTSASHPHHRRSSRTTSSVMQRMVVVVAALLVVAMSTSVLVADAAIAPYGSNTSSVSQSIVPPTRTVSSTESAPATPTYNTTNRNPVYVFVNQTGTFDEASLNKAVVQVTSRALHLTSIGIRVKSSGAFGSNSWATFTFDKFDDGVVSYQQLVRAVVDDFSLGAASITRTTGKVSALHVKHAPNPTYRVDLYTSATNVVADVYASAASIVYYAVYISTSGAPTAPTEAQLMNVNYAEVNQNAASTSLKMFGRSVCTWGAAPCKHSAAINFAAVSGRTYYVYTTMAYFPEMGTVATNTTTGVRTHTVTASFQTDSISGSTFKCDAAVMTYGCSEGDANCQTTSGMTTTCLISVANGAGTNTSACAKGTTCLGEATSAGHFGVRIYRGDNNAEISTLKVGNRPTTTAGVELVGSQVAAATVNTDGTTQLIRVTVFAPANTSINGVSTMKVRVYIMGTSTYLGMIGATSTSEQTILLRDMTPDGTSFITCETTTDGSHPDISAGRLIRMPASLSATSLAANKIITGVPSQSLCGSNTCASSVRCYIIPRHNNVQGRALLQDFAVYTSAVQNNAEVTVSTLRAASGACDCSSFTAATISQCTCVDERYVFTITGSAVNSVRDPNLQRIMVNVSGTPQNAMTMDFNSNYGLIAASATADVHCNASGAESGYVLANRQFTCFVAVRESTRAYPVPQTCLSVESTNYTQVSSLSPVTAVGSEGVFFSFTGYPGAYGKCEGTDNTQCQISLVLAPTSSCGSRVNVSMNVQQQHGLPTTASTITCTTSGLSGGNMRVGSSTAQCTIYPRDELGPISCCRTTAQPFSVSASGGASMSTPVKSSDFGSLTSTLTPPTSLPLGGSVVVSATVGSAAMQTTTIYIVDYPTPNSTISCSSTSVVALGRVTCTIYPFKGSAETFADPKDFIAVLTSNPERGSLTELLINSTSTKRPIIFDFVAGAMPGAVTLSAFSRYFADNTTRGNDDIVNNATARLRDAPITFTIQYGVATNASKLTCAGTSVNALQNLTCTIEVIGDNGKTAVNPSSPPFSVSVPTGYTVSSMSSVDGSMFKFNVTASGDISIGEKFNIHVHHTQTNTNITGSSFGPVTVVGTPTPLNTTLTCNGTTSVSSVRPGQHLDCVIHPGNEFGRTKALRSALEVRSTASTLPSELTTTDGGAEYHFNWTAPMTDRTATQYTLRVLVNTVNGAVVNVAVSPSDPSNTTSTMTCKSVRFGTTSVEIQRPMVCDVVLKDADGNAITHVFASELIVSSKAGTATAVKQKEDGSYTFNFTSNANAPLKTTIDVNFRTTHIATSDVDVIYGVPTVADTVVQCTSNVINTTGAVCTVYPKDSLGFTTSAPDAFGWSVVGGCQVTSSSRTPRGDTVTIDLNVSTTSASTTCRLTLTLLTKTLNTTDFSVVQNTTQTPPPTNPTLEFPAISVTFFGSRSGTNTFLSTDVITAVATHSALSKAVTYHWSVNGTAIAATGSSVSLGPYSYGVDVAVVATAEGYTNGTATSKVQVIRPAYGGKITVNVTSVNAFDAIRLACDGWQHDTASSAQFSYVFALVAKTGTITKRLARTLSSSIDLTVEFIEGADNVTNWYACYAVVNGIDSNITSPVNVTVTPVAVTSAKVLELVNKVPTLTSSSTDAQRTQFTQDVNAAASALVGLATTDVTATANLLDSLSKGVAVLETGGLSTAEKEVYTNVMMHTLSKTGSVTTAMTTNVLNVLKASAKVPLSSQGADNMMGSIDILIELLLKGTTAPARRSFQSLMVDTNTRNIGEAYKNAFDGTRAYLFTPGTTLGTTLTKLGSTFTLNSVVDVAASVNSVFNSQVVRTTRSDTNVIASVYFTFTKNPFTAKGMTRLYAYAVANSTGAVSSEVTVDTQSIGSNLLVRSYDLDADVYDNCTMSGATGTCAARATLLPPVYYAVVTSDGTTPAPTPMPSATPTSTPPPPSIVPTASPDDDSDSNTGVIVGVVVGVCAAFIIGAVILIVVIRKKREESARASAAAEAAAGQNPCESSAPENIDFQQQMQQLPQTYGDQQMQPQGDAAAAGYDNAQYGQQQQQDMGYNQGYNQQQQAQQQV
eukprot:PhM_4_TR18716/c1_g1_i1/m.62953